ncbi:hypothetical protein TNIN_485441 [Trichonephila inaurata madagascariensis]|uniref:Uncharacterized protein n=1 Tax=Trichonephila inaurata madagascariensis TaxID=2747483 RepID=A0A8X6X6C6_9ARAC|nr:hypothetical protein TNIN_485441 [Trichonephila inaurata madagascariensis]
MVCWKESRYNGPLAQLVRASANNAKVSGFDPLRAAFFLHFRLFALQLFEAVSSIQKNGMLKESRFVGPLAQLGAIDTEKWYAEGESISSAPRLAQLVGVSAQRDGRGFDPPTGQPFSALFNCLERSHRYRKMGAIDTENGGAEGESISVGPLAHSWLERRAINAKVAGSIPTGQSFFCTFQLFGWFTDTEKMKNGGRLKESRFRHPVSSVGWCVVLITCCDGRGSDPPRAKSFFLHFSIVWKGAIDTEKWYAEGESSS